MQLVVVNDFWEEVQDHDFPRYTGRSKLWKQKDLLCIRQRFNQKLKNVDLIPLIQCG